MAITELYSGSEAVSTTEWSLTTDSAGPDADTTDGMFQCHLDLSAMVAGDQYEFCIYEKVRAADTQRKYYCAVFTGAQAQPNVASPGLFLMHGWDYTLKKLAGTDRTITWSIRQAT